MFIHRQKQKGMVLICAVAILAVLSIMATSFVRMMTLNLQAAKNHLNYVDAKFAAIAGIENAKAKMWEFMLTRDNTSESTSISFTNNMYGNDAFTNSGTVGRTTDNGKIGRYEYNGNSYQFKIQDNQGKLNLNSHIAYQFKTDNTNNEDVTSDGHRILDIRQGYANRIMNNIILSLAQACGFGDDSSNIANSLRPLDATVPKFSSMYEVESILKNNSTNTDAINSFLNNVCVNSIMDSVCYTADYQDEKLISGSNINYYREYRSPINLKTVSQELLTALISNIHATITIPYPVIGYTEDNTQELTISDPSTQTYHISFSEKASSIAEQLLTYKNTITSMAKLEETIQGLLKMEKNTDGQYELNSNCPSKDSNVGVSDLTWTHICGDILIANFNPNVRENLYNTSHTIAKLVQKNVLYRIENDVKIPSHTTELCLYEMGHVDIISQGKITAQNQNLTVARAQIQESIAFGTTMTLTSFNDFNATSSNTSNSNIAYFPERHSSNSNDNILQNTCGYISGKYNNLSSSELKSGRWYNVHDGILAKRSLHEINKDNANCTQFDFTPTTIYSTTGSLHFWVKLTEDWYEPTMCFLFSASCKSEDTKQYIPYPVHYNSTTGLSEPDDYHDGIQMYVYKNSKGELIVSRLFFCGYFDSGGNYDGIESLAVDVSEDKLPDSKRAYARRDIKIDLGGDEAAHWKANEWNLVKIHWNDELAEDGLTATLCSYSQSKTTIETSDTNEKEMTINNIKTRTYDCVTYGPNSTTSPKFCVLNEKETITGDNSSLDRIQIHGMYRNQKSQGDSTSGLKSLFLFNETASMSGNSTMYDIKMDDDDIDELPKKISKNISYSSQFTFRIDNETNNETNDFKDPNKNPFLNYNLKNITQWGYVSSLTWIGYPEKTKIRFYNTNDFTISEKDHRYYDMSSTNVNPAYTTMSSLTHTADGSNRAILPLETLTDNNKVSNNGTLSCTVTLYNKTNYPTTLDSITAHIIYPVVYASTIIQ